MTGSFKKKHLDNDRWGEAVGNNVLAIVPARGGSKGIPRKNIRNLCGKPLIAYSIEVALRAKLIDRVIVSTEDEEIAEISKAYGAEVPFFRPQKMAGDDSSLADMFEYTLSRLREDGYNPNVTVTLYPTHPFRTPGLVDLLTGKALEQYGPVTTVKKVSCGTIPAFSKAGGTLKPAICSDLLGAKGDSKPYLKSHGLFLATNHDIIPKPYVHLVEDWISLIDIDTWEDFYLAEKVIQENHFEFGF